MTSNGSVQPSTGGANTTRSMLDEIERGSAADLLMAIRYDTCPPGPTFVSALDDLLLSSRPHQGGSTLQRGDLVELTGPSGSGKTTLLSFLLLVTLLPPRILIPLPDRSTRSVELGGKAQHAALLHPTSHRSPLPLLVRGMRAHITSCIEEELGRYHHPRAITPPIRRTIDETVRTALSRLGVTTLRPRYKQWYLSLLSLLRPPSLHLEPSSWQEKEGKDRELSLVVCDGFGDMFYPERWAAEAREGSRDGEAGMKDVMRVVQSLRQEMGAVVVLCVQGLFQPSKLAPFYASHLPPPFPHPYHPASSSTVPPSSSAVKTEEAAPPPDASTSASPHWPLNIQLTLTGRRRALPFPAETTLVDALRVAARGGQTGAYEGIVRLPGGRGLAGTLGGERWAWRIGGDGLENQIFV